MSSTTDWLWHMLLIYTEFAEYVLDYVNDGLPTFVCLLCNTFAFYLHYVHLLLLLLLQQRDSTTCALAAFPNCRHG